MPSRVDHFNEGSQCDGHLFPLDVRLGARVVDRYVRATERLYVRPCISGALPGASEKKDALAIVLNYSVVAQALNGGHELGRQVPNSWSRDPAHSRVVPRERSSRLERSFAGRPRAGSLHSRKGRDIVIEPAHDAFVRAVIVHELYAAYRSARPSHRAALAELDHALDRTATETVERLVIITDHG